MISAAHTMGRRYPSMAMASVLLVEDDDQLRRILTINFARRGYTVAEADSVETALEAVRAFPRPFDVIVLDIYLPDRTGWDVLRALHRPELADSYHTAYAPRVVVTTAVRPAPCRLDEFHPDAVLLKPFPVDALMRLVARMVPRPQGSLATQV